MTHSNYFGCNHTVNNKNFLGISPKVFSKNYFLSFACVCVFAITVLAIGHLSAGVKCILLSRFNKTNVPSYSNS